jgi:hypothetical protein
MDVEKNLQLFAEGHRKNKGRQPVERYASFDYCYNYFREFRERDRVYELADPDHIQLSCLQLAFYLASWGMLRGSSFLLEKSLKFYEPLIRNIAEFDQRIWDIDVDVYMEKHVEVLLSCREMVVNSLGVENKPSDTLVTKIMLGVFGNVPAFDDFFRKGFATHTFGKKSLSMIARFYESNKPLIDGARIYTFDFKTGEPTHRLYPKAKIIDMIGFMEGIRKRFPAKRGLSK